jgi:hypothetical protein
MSRNISPREIAQISDDFEILVSIIGPAVGAAALDLALDAQRIIFLLEVLASDAAREPVRQQEYWRPLDARNELRRQLGEPPVQRFPRHRKTPFTPTEKAVVSNSLGNIDERLGALPPGPWLKKARQKLATLRRAVDRAAPAA